VKKMNRRRAKGSSSNMSSKRAGSNPDSKEVGGIEKSKEARPSWVVLLMTVSILNVDISQGCSLMEINVEGKEKVRWVGEGFPSLLGVSRGDTGASRLVMQELTSNKLDIL
jgi:hypothetical protein